MLVVPPTDGASCHGFWGVALLACLLPGVRNVNHSLPVLGLAKLAYYWQSQMILSLFLVQQIQLWGAQVT